MNKLLIRYVVLLIALCLSQVASAGSGITYHGRLLKSDGTPVTESHVEFKIQIRTPGNENCLMYEEVHIKDLSQSSGIFAISLNDGTAATGNSEPFTLERVFQNRGTFNFGVGKCSGASTYSPNSSDGRKIAVEFNDGTFLAGTYEPLPTQSINFVPMAIESNTVGGFNAGSILRVVDGSGNPNAISALSIAQHTSLMDLIGGTSTSYLTASSPLAGANIVDGSVTDAELATGISGAKISGNIPGNAAGFTGNLGGDVTGAQGTTTVARIQGRVVDSAAPADGQVLKWSAGNTRWEPANDANSGAVASVTGTSPIAVSVGANPVVSIQDGTAAQKGAVQLALDGESNSAKALASNDSRLSDSRTPTAHSHTFASLTNSAGYMVYSPNNVACNNGEVLKKTANGWECGVDNAGGGGAVTSVGVVVPAYMTSSGGPITSSGDITLGFGSQTARTVFAAPTGGNGAPTFRALNIGDIFSTNTGAFLAASGACAAGEQLTYLSASDNISCQTYSITSGQVTAALTFTPANVTALANYLPLAGGTMGGNIAMGGNKITGLKNVPNVAADPAAGQDGQTLRWNQTAGQWEWFTAGAAGAGIATINGLSGSAQTIVVDAAGTAPGIVSNTTTHTISIPLASGVGVTSGTISKTDYDAFTAKVPSTRTITAGTGLTGGGDLSANRTLAVNVGTGASQIPQLDGSGKLDPAVLPAGVVTSNSLAGDVTGNFGASVVEKVRGVSVSATTPVNGQAMMLVSGVWTPTNFGIDDLLSNAGASQFASASCTASQTLTWSALTDTFTCSNIVIASSNITDGTIALADLATAVTDTLWNAGSGNVYRTSGSVGIGTNGPATALHVVGTVKIADGGETCNTGTHGGMIRYNSNNLEYCNGTAWQTLGIAGGITSLGGLSTPNQTLANGTTGLAPNWVSAGSAHTLHIPMASTASVTAGLLSKADYDTFNAKQAAGNYITSLTGEVTASGAGAAAATIANNAITNAKMADDSVNTAEIVNGAVTDAKIATVSVDKIVSAATKYFTYAPNGSACSLDQVLKWDTAGGGRWVCGAVSGTVTQVTSANTDIGVTNTTTTPLLTLNVGTGNNQIVKLNGSAQIPAVSGALLTNLNADNLGSGTVPDARLSTTVTQGLWGGNGTNVYRSSGNVGIGTGTPGKTLDVYGNTSGQATETGTSGTLNGNYFTTSYLPSATTTATVRNYFWTGTSSTQDMTGALLIGVEGNAVNSGAGTVNQIRAVSAFTNNSSTGTITTAIGTRSQVNNAAGGTISNGRGGDFIVNAAAGTIVNARGAEFSVTTAGGAVTNGIGVYIGTVAGGTSKYSLYANDATAPSYINGSVGIGTTTIDEKLVVNGNIKATSFISTSDRRLKTNIETSPGLDFILRLRGVEYNWRNNGVKESGVIAQEVEEVMPWAVVTDRQTGFKAVRYQNLISPLIESTKDLYEMCHAQQSQIDELREQNRALASENQNLKSRLEAIERRLGIGQ